MSNDGGVSESIGTMIFVGILIILAGGIFLYCINMAEKSTPADYKPVYVYTYTEVVPALSAHQIWDADSIKIFYKSAKGSYNNYAGVEYAGTENIRFFLYDPKGGSHEAIQSISMKCLKIAPGTEFYLYTTSDNISGHYHITNQYARIGDDTHWGTELLYPKPFARGDWNLVITNERTNTIISKKIVSFT